MPVCSSVCMSLLLFFCPINSNIAPFLDLSSTCQALSRFSSVAPWKSLCLSLLRSLRLYVSVTQSLCLSVPCFLSSKTCASPCSHPSLALFAPLCLFPLRNNYNSQGSSHRSVHFLTNLYVLCLIEYVVFGDEMPG